MLCFAAITLNCSTVPLLKAKWTVLTQWLNSHDNNMKNGFYIGGVVLTLNTKIYKMINGKYVKTQDAYLFALFYIQS